MSNFEDERKAYQKTGVNARHLWDTVINDISKQEEELKKNLIERSDQKNIELTNVSVNKLTYIGYNLVGISEVSFNLRARIEELDDIKDLEAIFKIPNLLEKCVDEYDSIDGDISQVAMEAVDNILYNEIENSKQKDENIENSKTLDDFKKLEIYEDVWDIIDNIADFTPFFENKEKNIDEISNNIRMKVDEIIDSVLDDYKLEGNTREEARNLFGNIDDITDEITEAYLEEGKEQDEDEEEE